jgi:hypothetical protein
VSIADLAERGRLIMARRDAEFAEQQEHLDGLQSGEGVETAELVP